MTVRLVTSMARLQSGVVRRGIRLNDDHPMAVGLYVRIG